MQVMALISSKSTLTGADMIIYNVYGSKSNKLDIDKLEDMTIPSFVKYQEWIEIREAQEIAAHKDQELMNK